MLLLLLLSLLTLLACRPDDAEHCDGLDNDGDGLIDDDDPDVTGLLDWHADADGDSFGDPDTEVMSCRQPGGHVADKTDCDDSDASVRNAPSWYADVDGDRFGDPANVVVGCVQPARTIGCDEDPATPLVLDCDDTASWVHPGAAEVCDGVDDDCDGLIDDEDRDVTGQTQWFPDADGDGYGLAGSSELACDAPTGRVDDNTDCEDTIAAVNPGADEICDDIDDDCDGLVDGQDDSLRDAPTWYADADGDGYGDPNVAQAACHSPPGAVIDATDCNDSTASANPGATEVCDDLDNDCDALTDGQDDSLSGGTTWYADADGDGYGDAATTSEACEAPVGYVGNASDCDDVDRAVGDCASTTGCSAGFYCLELSGEVNRDHTDGPFTDNPSESWGVAPGVHNWLVADGSTVDFVILDPDTNGGASVVITRGGNSWQPAYTCPETFTVAGGGASGAVMHVAGLASGWSDSAYFAGIAATLTIQFSDGTSQTVDLVNGVNLDEWGSTSHTSPDTDVVRVYEDTTYGRHIDALSVPLDSGATIDTIVLVDDSTVHTGTAEMTSVPVFAITVGP